MGLVLVREVMVSDIRLNRHAIETCQSVCRYERQTHAIAHGMAEEWFTPRHRRRPPGHMTVVNKAMYEQLVTECAGTTADHHRMRVEPVLDLGVYRDA